MEFKEIKPLKKEFTGKGEVKGYRFKRIKQTGLVTMYEVSNGDNIHYEIFKRRVNHRFRVESYPSSKRFGVIAFTALTREKAEIIFNKLQKEEEARINR